LGCLLLVFDIGELREGILFEKEEKNLSQLVLVGTKSRDRARGIH
jgi:hypothetical protein